MNDSILDRYSASSSGRITEATRTSDSESTHDLGAFGYLQGIRDRAVMLELQRKDGSILAIGYGWLERAEYDPSDGITLSLQGQRIRIKGRNLNVANRSQVQLFQTIVRHRAAWIREAANEEHMTTDDGHTIIEAIEW